MGTMWDKGVIENIPLGATVRRKVGNYIFRWRPGIGQERMDYYTPTNPRTGKQQAWRKVFAEGIAAWHALSEGEKEEWRQEAKKKRMVGQHLFQSVWLKTHRLIGNIFTVGTTVIGSADHIITGLPMIIGTWTIGSSQYITAGEPITVGLWSIGSPEYITGP